MRYRLLCLFLLIACGEPEPIELQEEAPQPAPATPTGIAVKAALVDRQQQLQRRLESVEDAAEGRPSQIRVAWSVVLQRLGTRTEALDRKVDQMDPQAEDWEEVSRTLSAELDALAAQLEAELGALERGR